MPALSIRQESGARGESRVSRIRVIPPYREEIIATRATNEILLHLIKLVLSTLFGLLTYQAMSVGAVCRALRG
jgi:hypothetical protein